MRNVPKLGPRLFSSIFLNVAAASCSGRRTILRMPSLKASLSPQSLLIHHIGGRRTFATSNNDGHPLLHLRLLLRKTSSLRRGRPSPTTTTTTVDSYSLLRSLKALLRSSRGGSPSSSSSLYRPGIQIHNLVVALGFHSVVFLHTALLTMYSNSGHLRDAHFLFDEMSRRTLVAWTALISAYVNNQKPRIALDLFRAMQLEKVEPDLVTLTVALSACADLGALDAGKWMHAYVRKQRLSGDLKLTNALIDMYCKCGDIATAHDVFRTVEEKDVATWTSIITGYALHGMAGEALHLFNEMDCRPNGVTFIGVLAACSHGGLVEEGRRQWENMTRNHGVKPDMSHYGCMVDMLCRAGRLEEAYRFVLKMPVQANAVIWRTLLGACSLKGNVSIATIARKKLLELEPDHVGDGVSMSNAYAKAGMWEEKETASGRRRKGRRAPGCSLIEVGSRVHEFVAGDKRKMKSEEIQQVLDEMACVAKNTDYSC